MQFDLKELLRRHPVGVASALLLMGLLLAPDLVLGILLEGGDLALEVIEFLLDSFFEISLGLSDRAAQMVTGWLGLGLMLFLMFFGLRRARRALHSALEQAPEKLHEAEVETQHLLDHAERDIWIWWHHLSLAHQIELILAVAAILLTAVMLLFL